MKEPIKVETAYWADRAQGIYKGQIFNDYRIDEDGDYIVKHNGGEFILLARQVELVESKVECRDCRKGEKMIKIKLTQLYRPDEDRGFKTGDIFESHRRDEDGDYFVMLGNKEYCFVCDQVQELGGEPLDDDKPFRDALSEIGKRIREHEQKIEQLKAVSEAIKKLRNEV